MKLPPAPFPGMKVETSAGLVHLSPLETVQAHFELAGRMRNCLAGQVSHVLKGRVYFFHVRTDFCEEHCLGIKWNGKFWSVGDCRCVRNRMPHDKVMEAVHRWTEEMMGVPEDRERYAHDENAGAGRENQPCEDFLF